jgi:hypothetical protein
MKQWGLFLVTERETVFVHMLAAKVCLLTRVHHTLCWQPYGKNVLCKYIWISHQHMNNGSMLKI